jgi:dTDP-4-amino-4,6-dideoxygalactose transaminase
MRISLGTVNVNDKAKRLMRKVLDEGKIGQSEYIEEFEEKFAKFIGSKYAIAVSSGTMADTVALATMKHFFPLKRKVMVPALTFIAQINSVIYNHLRPVFVDTGQSMAGDENTLCSFPVDLLGEPFHERVGERVVEDACEALGSRLNKKYCGTLGDLGTFSFFPSHSISTGEGGMIITDNKKYADTARRLRTQGRRGDSVEDKFKFDEIGFNGRMTTMQAVIGLGVMDDLAEILERRRQNYWYMGGEDNGVVPHGFPVEYGTKKKRDEKLRELTKKGIECRKLFSCIPTDEKAYAFLAHKRGEFPIAEDFADTFLYVPCHQNLSKREMDFILKNL